jgi:hypothetical protein
MATCTIETNWWGFDIIMDEDLTNDFAIGTGSAGSLGPILAGALVSAGVVTGGAATVIGTAFAAAIGAKAAEIKIIDNGAGVHWPVTWAQLAPLVVTVGFPPTLTVMILVFIHPFANPKKEEPKKDDKKKDDPKRG